MTGEFNGRHEEVLRASDRAHALDEEARDHIAERALSAFDHHRSGELAPVELITAEPVSVDLWRGRPTRARWLVAAAATIVAVAAFTGLATRNDRSAIEVGAPVTTPELAAGPETTPELAVEVRDWCRENLGELNSNMQLALRTPDDTEARAAAVAVLVDAVDGYFWLLLDSGIREGSSRTNEIGRFQGGAAIIRDKSEPLSITEVKTLIQEFDDELAVTSNGSPACEIRT